MTTIQGLDKLTKKLNRLEDFQKVMKPPMTRALALVHDDIAKYPKKAKGAFSAMATAKQRRAYWAGVSSGRISHREGVGYVRSGITGKKWTVKIRQSSRGVKGELGNNAPGVFWTQSDARQQPFHAASGWMTDKKALEQNQKDITRIFQIVVKREVNR